VTTAPAQTEAQFQKAVIDAAHLLGWRVHHTRPARSGKGWRTPIQGDAGFPDLVLARGERVIFAELKRDRRSKPTPEQAAWLETLGTSHLDVYIWRPEDWDDIERILR
jgi:hypothetical protein